MRQTRQRRLVWETIQQLGSHRSADDIAERLRQDGSGLPLSTVYRSLDALTASGVLRAVNLGSGPTYYELVTEDHQHAICERCGVILHLDHRVTAELERRLLEREGFRATRTEVVVLGLCQACFDGGQPDHTAEGN